MAPLDDAALGGFDGFVLDGSGGKGTVHAIEVTGPGLVDLGPALTVRDFTGAGLLATEGATVRADGIAVQGTGGAAIEASWGAFVDVSGVQIDDCQVGLYASSHAAIRASGFARVTGAVGQGVQVLYGSMMNLDDAIVEEAGVTGVNVSQASVIKASGAILRNHGVHGVWCAANSSCSVEGATVTGNASGDLQAITVSSIEVSPNTVAGTMDPPLGIEGAESSIISP